MVGVLALEIKSELQVERKHLEVVKFRIAFHSTLSIVILVYWECAME